MSFYIGKVKVHIDIALLLFTLVVFLFKELHNYFQNYLICFLFVVFHELSHIFVATIFGVECVMLNIRLCGMNAVFMSKNKLSMKWVYILIAGPISNVILAIMFKNVSLVRDINIALALVNLLPISPLDGFEISKILLSFFMPKKKLESVLKILKVIILLFMILLGIYLTIEMRNPSVLIFVMYVVTLRNAVGVAQTKYVTKKLQKYYKILLNLLHFSLKFSII